MHAALQLLHAALQLLHAALQLLHAALRVLHAALRVRHAALRVLHAAVRVLHAALQLLHAAVRVRHAAVQLRHAALQLLHAALQISHAALQLPQAALQLPQAALQLPQAAPHETRPRLTEPRGAVDYNAAMPEPDEIEAHLRREVIVACVRTDDAEVAEEASFAALRAGVRVLEVTLTTPGALRIIERLAKEPDAIPGAGTALDPEDVRRVQEAGGRFALSPVTDEAVIAAAKERGLFFAPGAATPTEVLFARRKGARVVKIFPIGPLGGVAFLRAIGGPLKGIPFLPTNGVKTDEIKAYLDAGSIALGFGREVFPPEALARRDMKAVEEAARKLVAAVRSQVK